MQRASVMITQLLLCTISGGEGDHAENGSVAVKRSFIAVGRRKCYRLHCPGCGHHRTLPGPGPAPGAESGSFQHNTNNYKVKTTCKLSRTLNTLSGAQLQLFNYTIIRYKLKTYVNAICTRTVHLTSCTSNIAYDSLRLHECV